MKLKNLDQQMKTSSNRGITTGMLQMQFEENFTVSSEKFTLSQL